MRPAFEFPIAVTGTDIDQLGHVNNVAYLRWVQQAAEAHWTAVAPAEDQANLFWVVLRHEIDYLKPANLADNIIARTWVGQATRLRFERFTEILRAKDQILLAKAKTIWCPIDPHRKRPIAVSDEVRGLFSATD
jgi:acyl-CoA thioester hydrolase